MATEDVAVIGVALPTDGIEKGIKALDTLAGTGAKVEKSMEGVEKAAAKTGKSLATLGQTNGAGLDKVATDSTAAAAGMKKIADAATEADTGLKKVGASAGAATGQLGKMEISAKQTAFALRGIPAQFTDIVTSIQAGQAPLTVLLQQGGQLKDMFGGVGNAARALGGYVVGLVNPFTVAAGAVAAVTFAYYKGSQEAEAYNRALILSGNAVGVTSGQLQVMAQRIALVSGTQSAAAEGLAAFAQSGSVAAENLEKVSAAAVRFESATGIAVKETVKSFEALGKSPLEASLKLNESTNFLTVSLYEQIRALTEQGKTTEAANLAQTAFANTLDSQTAQIKANLGTIEKGWQGVKNAIKGAGDALLGIGRVDGSDAQLATLKKAIAQREDYSRNRKTGEAASDDPRLNAMRQELLLREKGVGYEAQSAALTAEQAKNVLLLSEYRKRGLEFATNTEKRDAAIRVETEATQKLLSQGLITQAELQTRIANIKEKYKDKAAPKENISEQQRDLASYVNTLSQRLDKELELTEVQKAQNFLNSLGKTGQIKQVQETVLGLAKQIDAEKELDKANKAAAKSLKEWQEQDEAFTKAREVGNIEIAKGVAGVKAYTQAIDDQIALTTLELSLTGATAEARAVAIEQFKIQVALKKELAEIDKNAGFDTAQKDAQKAIASAAAGRASANAVTKVYTEQWQKAADQIENSITDALMRGFESGKGFAENLRDTIVNIFKTTVLKDFVGGAVKSLLGSVTGSLGLSGAANAGSAANAASSASSAMSYLTDFGGTVGNKVGDFGQYLINSSGSSQAVGDFGATLVSNSQAIGDFAGAAGDAIGYINSAIALSEGKLGQALGSAIGTYFGGPIGSAIGNEIGKWVDGLFDGHGYVSGTGSANAAFDSNGAITAKNNFSQSFEIQNNQADGFVKSLLTSYTNAAESLGIKSTGGTFAFGSNNSDGGKFGVSANVGSAVYNTTDIKASPEALQLEASRAVFAALQGSELPAYLSKLFDGITASSATTQQIDQALAYAGALKQVREALTETREPLQILKDNVADSLKALGTTAETFKADFVKSIDAGIDPATLAKFQKLGAGLEELSKQSGTAAAALDNVLKSLKTTGANLQVDLLNAQGKPAEARALTRNLAIADFSVDATPEQIAARKSAYDYNETLRDQIAALNAAQTAAESYAQAQRQASDDAEARRQSIQNERNGLQDQLDNLTLTNTDLLTKQRDALDQSNRALFDQVQTAKAAAEALRITTGLQDTGKTLAIDLLRAQGNEAAAVAAERTLAIKGYNAEQISIYDSNAAVKAMVTELTRLSGVSKTLAAELPGVIAKFQTPAQRTASSYSGIAQNLIDAGLSKLDLNTLTSGLVSSSKEQIGALATTLFNTLPESAVEARLALVRATGGLADLKDAATDLSDALQKQVATELGALITKAQTPAQRTAAAYRGIATDLRAAGLSRADVDSLTSGLVSASKESVISVATQLYNELPAGADAARLALIKATSGLLDLKDAAGELSKTVATELATVITKFQTPEQRTQTSYQGIAKNLLDAGLSGADLDALTSSLVSASKDTIAKVATELFNSLPASADDARLALIRAASGLADLKDAAEAAGESFRSALAGLGNTRGNLQVQLLEAQGDNAGALALKRKTELAAILNGRTGSEAELLTTAFNANSALEDQITATRAAAAAAAAFAQAQQQAADRAAEAAKQLKDAWQSATDSIFDEVRRIRGITGAGSSFSFADAQAKFSITAAQASAGDQAAAKALPELSRILLELAETNATSLLQLRALQGTTAGTLESIANQYIGQFGLSLPRLDTGTNSIPSDGAYYLHAGEAVVPYKPALAGRGNNNDALVAEMQALRSELAELKSLQATNNDSVAITANTLRRVTRGGDNMITKDYAAA